jgi:cytochrome c-type biogenesis protein CcmH
MSAGLAWVGPVAAGTRRAVGRLAAVLVAAGFVVALVVAAHGSPPTVDERARRIERELRCPVCQGLSVADSTSATSAAIAADVRRRVAAGQTDQEVRDAYVARYGRWILLTPNGGVGLGAVLVPVTGVVVVGAALALAVRRWSRHPDRAPTKDDVALVAEVRRRSGPMRGGAA